MRPVRTVLVLVSCLGLLLLIGSSGASGATISLDRGPVVADRLELPPRMTLPARGVPAWASLRCALLGKVAVSRQQMASSGANKQVCGDGRCTGKENVQTCPGDCSTSSTSTSSTSSTTLPPVSCGDGTCNGNENCATCSRDCGSCPTCGDGRCEPFRGETCLTCRIDCTICI